MDGYYFTSQLQLFPAAQPSQQDACEEQEHFPPERQPQLDSGLQVQSLQLHPFVPANALKPTNKRAQRDNIEKIFINFLCLDFFC